MNSVNLTTTGAWTGVNFKLMPVTCVSMAVWWDISLLHMSLEVRIILLIASYLMSLNFMNEFATNHFRKTRTRVVALHKSLQVQISFLIVTILFWYWILWIPHTSFRENSNVLSQLHFLKTMFVPSPSFSKLLYTRSSLWIFLFRFRRATVSGSCFSGSATDPPHNIYKYQHVL